MKTAVRYYSRSGNTKKLADAIAKALGTSAKTVEEKLEEPVDLLFIGGALYAGNIDKQLKGFIQELDAGAVKAIVVFSNAAGPNTILPKIEALASEKGIHVLNEVFSCRGKFLLAHKGRPNEQDCADAAAFVQKVMNQAKEG